MARKRFQFSKSVCVTCGHNGYHHSAVEPHRCFGLDAGDRCTCEGFIEPNAPVGPETQTAAPRELRDAAPGEAEVIVRLAMSAGFALISQWDALDAEQTKLLTMTQVFGAALAHALGQLMAAAPRRDATDAQWQAWLAQNTALVREAAEEARRRLMDAAPVEDEAPRVIVAEPTFVM